MRSARWIVVSFVVAWLGCGDNLPAGTVVFDQVPSALTRETHAVFEFHVEDATTPAALHCVLDGAAPVACTSPFAVDVTDGEHTMSIGTAAATTAAATHAWRVDTIAPDTTLTAGPPMLDNELSPAFGFESAAGDVAGFACALDGAAFTACTSPTTLSALDGAHTFAVRAIDRAGNVDPTPASQTWTIDSIGPMVTITAGPAGPVDTAQPTFTFTVSNDALSPACAVDDGTFAACESPTTTATLAQGDHTFTVRAHDLAGNVASASRAFTVDTLGPTVSITAGPSGATNVASPTWAFTAGGAPTAVECRIDSATFTACTGSFTATLADGSHTFEVRVTDAAGNTGGDSRTIALDTVIPTVTITAGVQGPTNVTAPTFTFTTTDAPTVIECRIDAAAFAACTTTSSFVSPTLGAGPHSFEVRVADAATNASTATRSFTIDTAAPTATITSGPTGPTNDDTPTFTFTTAGSPISTRCHFDAAVLVDCSAATFSAPLAEGPHTFEVVVTDAAGNPGSASRSFAVDITAPTVAITSGPNGPTADTTPTFGFTTSGATATTCHVDGALPVACSSPFTTPPLGGGPHTLTVDVADDATNTGTASRTFTVDTSTPVLSIVSAPADPNNLLIATFGFTFGVTVTTATCTYDGGAATDCFTGPGTGAFSTLTGAEGPHTFTVTVCADLTLCATDSYDFTADRTPPQIVITPPADPNRSSPLSIAFAITGGATQIRCRIDGGAAVPCASPFVTATLADGPHTFEVTATDAATNAATSTVGWTTDTAPPVVTLTGGPTGATNLAPLPTFTFTTTGAPVSVTCAYDAGAPVDCSAGAFAVPALFADHAHEGTHTLHIVATDAAANTFTLDQAFVVDTVAEAIAITGDGVSSDSSPTFGVAASPSTSNPVALTCRVGTAPFQVCGPTFNPGTLADGSHTLEAHATDAAGNVGTRTFAFQIDTQGPVLSIVGALASPTADPRPLLQFAASDAGTSGTPPGSFTLTCRIDGILVTPCVDTIQAAAELEAAGAEGNHVYTVVAVDTAAPTPNTATLTVPFTVDRKAPVLALTTRPDASTPSASPTFVFTATDVSGIGAATCRLDGFAVPCAPGVAFTPVTPLDRGLDHTLTIDASDTMVPANTGSLAYPFHVQSGHVAFNAGLPAGVKVCFNGLAGPGNNGGLALCTEDTGPFRLASPTQTAWSDINFVEGSLTSIPIASASALCTGTCVLTFTTAVPHGYATGDAVAVFNVDVFPYNGLFGGITVLNATQWRTNPIGASFPFAATATGGTAAKTSGPGFTSLLGAQVMTNRHGRAVSAGFGSPSGSLVTDNTQGRTINVLAATNTGVPLATAVQAGALATFTAGFDLVSAAASGSTATFVAATSHLLVVGQPVAIAGVPVAGYNGNWTVDGVSASVPGGAVDTFTATLAVGGLGPSTGGFARVPHGVQTYQSITVSGVGVAGYNGAWQVSAVSASIAGGPIDTFAANLTQTGLAPSSGGSTNTIAFTTSVASAVTPGVTVTVQGVAEAGYNRTWRVGGFSGFVGGATQFSVIQAAVSPTLLPPSSGGTVFVPFNGFRAQGSFETTLTWPQQLQFTDDLGAPLEMFAVRQASSLGSVAGGWSPNRGAVVVHGSFVTSPPPFLNQTPKLDLVPAGGTVRAISGTVATSTSSLTDLYVAVHGKTPDGTPTTGGVFWSCDSWFPSGLTPTGGTYAARMTGFADADKPLVWSVTNDLASAVLEARPCGSASYGKVVYAALRGGGQLYKTIDGGSTWSPSAGTGADVLPAGAHVFTIAIDPSNHNVLYAGTSVGLYVSIDAGARWKLDGLAGKKVRNVLLTNHALLATVATAANAGATAAGTTATIRTTAAHGLAPGQAITLASVGGTSSPYNGTWIVTATPTTTTFTVTLQPIVITAVSQTGTTATYVTNLPHGIALGATVTLTVSGVPVAGYNGTIALRAVAPATSSTPAGQTLEAILPAGLPSSSGGTISILPAGGGSVQKPITRMFVTVDDACASDDGVVGHAQAGCTPDPSPVGVYQYNP